MPATIDIYKGDRADFSLLVKAGSEEETPVVAVDTSADEITVEDDWTSSVEVGETIRLQDHPDGGGFEVASAVKSGGNTVIDVKGNLTNDTAEGFVLFPWDVGSDFDRVRAQARLQPGLDPIAEWDTDDGTLAILDGDGTGDRLLFDVPPETFNQYSALTYEMDVEAIGAGGEPLTIIRRKEIEINLLDDVTR